MNTLPLRQNSVLSQALNAAKYNLDLRLVSAVKKFGEKANEATWRLKSDGFDARPGSGNRALAIAAIANFDAVVAMARAEFEAALKEYDEDAEELRVWLGAVRARDCIVDAARHVEL